MNLYKSIRKGFKNPNFCEDFALAFPLLNERVYIGVISDGCSGGKDSHFASVLQCKLIRKIALMQSGFYSNLENTETFSLLILNEFMKELRLIFSLMDLQTAEGVATLILMVYDKKTKTATVRALGDGILVFDSEIIEIQQNNIPDYPAYFLDSSSAEIQNYLTEYVFTRQNCKNIAISTDGIKSFINRKNPTQKTPINVLEYLLIDESLHHSIKMIKRKNTILKSQYDLENYDDLGILRFLI